MHAHLVWHHSKRRRFTTRDYSQMIKGSRRRSQAGGCSEGCLLHHRKCVCRNQDRNKEVRQSIDALMHFKINKHHHERAIPYQFYPSHANAPATLKCPPIVCAATIAAVTAIPRPLCLIVFVVVWLVLLLLLVKLLVVLLSL